MAAYLRNLILAALICGPALSAEPSANTRLMQAVWQRDHDGIAAALKDGASPNYIAPFSEFKSTYGGPAWSSHPDWLASPLGLAARWGDVAAMDALIEAGVDVNLHARAGETSLPAANPRVTRDMTRRLIERGYRPTALDITTALGLRGAEGWDDWAKAVLDAPGVAHRLAAIEAGTDPDYQKLIAEQKADQDRSQQKTETEAFEGQLQEAEQAAQSVKAEQALMGVAIGDLVCSKPGIYRTKYVARVEARSQGRIQLKIIGGYNRAIGDFHSGEMRWDDAEKWIPCQIR